MKFNMGCGHRKLDGYVNVDASAECAPDEVFDLERTPWPWPDGRASEIRFIHSLEHMGGDPKVFLAIMQEIYRIGAPGCEVVIHVPHPRHDNFIGDPTHVRAITPQMLELFDRRLNDEIIRLGGSNSPFARYLDVDFEIVRRDVVLDEPYFSQLKSGEIDSATSRRMIATLYNIAREYRISLRVRKPVRSGA
jgi:hypothetical protein